MAASFHAEDEDPPQNPWTVFDIDGTYYRHMLGIDVVTELWRKKHIDPHKLIEFNRVRAAFVERKAKHDDLFRAFVHALYDLDCLGGITVEAFEEAGREVAERYGGRVFQFSRELHAVAKEDGHKVAAISGSMWPAVKRFSEMRGFDVAVGTEPHRNGDRLSSERALDKVPMRDKAAEVARLAAQLDVDRRPTVVVGDTVSDIAMLALARYPIAFNPEAALARVARARGWALVYERKDSVLAFRAQLGPRKNALQEVPFSSILPVTLAHALEARLEKEGMLTYGG